MSSRFSRWLFIFSHIEVEVDAETEDKEG
jgi:hypothetical protein